MSLRMGGVLRASRKMTEGERGIAAAGGGTSNVRTLTIESPLMTMFC
jgi:hypothetical protein